MYFCSVHARLRKSRGKAVVNRRQWIGIAGRAFDGAGGRTYQVGRLSQGNVNGMEVERMKRMQINFKRREFLKIGSLAVASAAIARHAGDAPAQQQGGPPRLDEKDPQAQGLGYKHDATKVDRQKFAKYKAGEVCANCRLYQGRPGEPWGPCQIFQGKHVSAKGWCSAYVKKS
jgi:hypothetical protein